MKGNVKKKIFFMIISLVIVSGIIFAIITISINQTPSLPIPPYFTRPIYSQPIRVYEGSFVVFPTSEKVFKFYFPVETKIEGSWELISGCEYINFFVFDELNFYKWKAKDYSSSIYKDIKSISGKFNFTVEKGGNYYFVFYNEALFIKGTVFLKILKQEIL